MRNNAVEQGSKPSGVPVTPVVLELGDGSKLVLDDASASPVLARAEATVGERISLDDAMRGCGQPFAGYRRLRD